MFNHSLCEIVKLQALWLEILVGSLFSAFLLVSSHRHSFYYLFFATAWLCEQSASGGSVFLYVAGAIIREHSRTLWTEKFIPIIRHRWNWSKQIFQKWKGDNCMNFFSVSGWVLIAPPNYSHDWKWKYKSMTICLQATQHNPLPTDDAFWHHLILAACYQLVQSALKIGSALAKRVG